LDSTLLLASASPWRARIASKPKVVETSTDPDAEPRKANGAYRPWAELWKRTFGIDVLECPTCNGRMELLAVVTDPKSIARYLRALGESDDVPARSPSCGPPYGKSTVLRRRAQNDVG
jgi:hypothetical protein